LLTALDPDNHLRKAPPMKVFLLRYRQNRSLSEIARICDCGKSLVALRLKTLQEKLPWQPQQLRELSAHIEATRGILTKVSARWRAPQEPQRAAWMAAAKEAKSSSRLGQSGTLSGFLLFTKINCTLAQFGQTQVDAPPDHPQFPDLAAQNFVITNTGGVIALKLTCPTDPGDNTIVRGSAPVSQGRETCSSFRILGTCPAAVGGSADITGLYTARYGVPPVGKKVYVQVNQFVDGWEDLPVTFSAIVPAGS